MWRKIIGLGNIFNFNSVKLKFYTREWFNEENVTKVSRKNHTKRTDTLHVLISNKSSLFTGNNAQNNFRTIRKENRFSFLTRVKRTKERRIFKSNFQIRFSRPTFEGVDTFIVLPRDYSLKHITLQHLISRVKHFSV